MYFSLFALLCAFFLYRRNPVLCSLPSDFHSSSDLHNSSDSLNHSAHSSSPRLYTSFSSDRHSQNAQRRSDNNALHNRLNKKFVTSSQSANQVLSNGSRRSVGDLNQFFHKVYESNYAHFCPCPPELAGAHHSLEGAEDRTITECIFLPLTTVQYRCVRKAKKQSGQIVNRLICDLDRTTNRLNWIIEADDKLLDLDDLLVYRDRFTAVQTGRNETMEIQAQSANLSEFSVEFLQCNDRKLIVFTKHCLGF